MSLPLRVALIGDYDPAVTAHRAIPAALRYAGAALDCDVDGCWLATDRIDEAPTDLLNAFDAFWCVPASPYRSTTGALRAIRFARENNVPFLGTCGGFQHAVLEFARNVMRVADAAHAELDPASASPVIAPLSCSLIEVQGDVRLVEGARLHACYGRDSIREGYHCSYGINEEHTTRLADAGMVFNAFAGDGSVRGFELPDHAFFVGTLFQPERAALDGHESPPVVALLRAALADTQRSPLR